MLLQSQPLLDKYAIEKETSKLWRQWSYAVEKGFFRFLRLDKSQRDKLKGRGEPRIARVKIDPSKVNEHFINDPVEAAAQQEADRSLKQSRRLQHLADRTKLAAATGVDPSLVQQYSILNLAASTSICQACDSSSEESELATRINELMLKPKHAHLIVFRNAQYM